MEVVDLKVIINEKVPAFEHSYWQSKIKKYRIGNPHDLIWEQNFDDLIKVGVKQIYVTGSQWEEDKVDDIENYSNPDTLLLEMPEKISLDLVGTIICLEDTMQAEIPKEGWLKLILFED